MAARKNRELKGVRAPGGNVVHSLTYFQSDDYAKALAKYEALSVIYK